MPKFNQRFAKRIRATGLSSGLFNGEFSELSEYWRLEIALLEMDNVCLNRLLSPISQ
jgi:hypothetical protein